MYADYGAWVSGEASAVYVATGIGAFTIYAGILPASEATT